MQEDGKMERILLTGAAGKIGSWLRQSLRGAYPVVRVTDIEGLGEASSGEEVFHADLADLAAVERAMADCDAVVHMGAIGEEADWDPILNSNIIGTYNIFEAAYRSGVKRVVFASTLHVTGFYRCSQKIDPSVPLRPDSRYGVSKAFGENLGRMYADKHGLSCVCLRIGTFGPRPRGKRMLSTWIARDDMTQLVRGSLDAPDIHFEILYGMSNNSRSWWNNPSAERIGYQPQHSADKWALDCMATSGMRDLAGNKEPFMKAGFHKLFQGSKLAYHEFDGNVDDID
jgi:uronate dehydrogenase